MNNTDISNLKGCCFLNFIKQNASYAYSPKHAVSNIVNNMK